MLRLLAGLLPLFVAGVAAQEAPRPAVAITAGPAVIVETWHLSVLRIPDTWYEGVSLGLRVSVPIVGAAAATVHGLAFWEPDGRTLQSATAGIEFRAGARRQLPLALTLGLVRQPAEGLCVETCPPDFPRFGHLTHPAIGVSLGYEWLVWPKLGLGPEFALTRALRSSEQFYGIHLSLRVTGRL